MSRGASGEVEPRVSRRQKEAQCWAQDEAHFGLRRMVLRMMDAEERSRLDSLCADAHGLTGEAGPAVPYDPASGGRAVPLRAPLPGCRKRAGVLWETPATPPKTG